ncbi:MAG: preprotein translocase subunit SecD [ANME-2 cluster archaeon]|nr:preprotein translocase subunit SecD [ANME-2 cluster archaeon]MDF1531132.1 preprotein translocase subunit SecD [ANME-2 cluster archaeon]
MNGEDVERGLSSDPRVMLMVGAILISLILLFLPAVFPELGVGGIKYGLDLDGGSWLHLKPEGALVQVDADMGNIIAHDYGIFLNETVTITQQTTSSVTFETHRSVTAKGIESLGYGQAAVSSRGGVYSILLQTDKNTAITKYLENRYKTEVVVFDDGDGKRYEIRKKTSPDELAAILQPVGGSVTAYEDGVSITTLTETKEILEDKLNLFGLSDVKPVIVGREYILIDLAGIDIDTAMNLAGTPGKFEIRVQIANNQSVHAVYGEDIQTVSFHRMEDNVWGVPFTLTQEGADALRQVAIETNAVGDPDNHEITMYLDNRVIYSAPLSYSLAQSMRVVPIQDLVASFGSDTSSEDKARELESHLKAGALPVNVEVIGSGQVPASLGSQFKELTAIAGLLAIITVSFIVFLRYRRKEIMLPMIITSLSEVVMILGFASAVKWQLDLPAITGIIAVIGTGIDHLVVITDEVLYEGKLPPTKVYNSRINRAFGIIFAAASTTIIAMIWLVWMGFGALKGFALTTIVGVLIGVLIARPVYARIIKHVLEEGQE